MRSTWDDIVVGAGIIGLAHARALSRLGRAVLVVERSPRASGASVRNFGMVWPMGQPAGERVELALRSRTLWVELLEEAGLWHDPVGSLHAAYYEDEEAVLGEFAATAAAHGYDARLISADEALALSPRLRRDGLRCALWSATEVCVDPREVVASLPSFLGERHGVAFRFGASVSAVEPGSVWAGDERLSTERVWLCPGDDVRSLFPGVLGDLGLVPCKLQMMRARGAAGARIGPMLAAGLTLAHYGSFADCPSLPALKAGLEARNPGYAELGIHVMVSQHANGDLTIGDSHVYGDAITPFDRSDIDDRILRYLAGFFDLAGAPIVERWHGVYAKHPTQAWVVAEPVERVTAVTGLGGAGMTLSFGLAERVVREALG